MGFEIIKILTLLAFLFGIRMATKEMKYLSKSYYHVKDSISYEMIKRDGVIDPLLLQHKVDSLHRYRLLEVGYAKPKSK